MPCPSTMQQQNKQTLRVLSSTLCRESVHSCRFLVFTNRFYRPSTPADGPLGHHWPTKRGRRRPHEEGAASAKGAADCVCEATFHQRGVPNLRAFHETIMPSRDAWRRDATGPLLQALLRRFLFQCPRHGTATRSRRVPRRSAPWEDVLVAAFVAAQICRGDELERERPARPRPQRDSSTMTTGRPREQASTRASTR